MGRAAGVLLALVLAAGSAAAQGAASPDQASPEPGSSPDHGSADSRAVWVRQGEAELQVLDKVNARTSKIDVRDGASAQVGSLTIAVQSCLVRPPDQAPDAVAFLIIKDSHPDAPGFRGWIFRSDPAVSMLQHPIYDVRVLGCRA